MVNAEVNQAVGATSVGSATVEQLERANALLEKRLGRRRPAPKPQRHTPAVSTARVVPVTRDELEGDEAFETLRACGLWSLLRDTAERFRAADGFSHSRALAFQATLALLPAVIAVVGLASALDVDAFTRLVRRAFEQIAPGPAGEVLTTALRQGSRTAREDSGEVALALGGFAAALAGTTAMAQVERG